MELTKKSHIMKCKYCDRELATKKQITKNGCNWCDIDEFYKKQKKDKK